MKLSKEVRKIWISRMASRRRIKKRVHAVKITGRTREALIPDLYEHEEEECFNNDLKI